MTHFVSSTSVPNSIYLHDPFGGINTYYETMQFGALNQVNMAHSDTLRPISLSSENSKKYIQNLLDIHQEYIQSIKLIGQRLGWEVSSIDFQISNAFTLWLKEGKCLEINCLNLSGLGLKVLPPQITLFKNLRELDLSNNHLRLLPPELQRLPLQTLNISNNTLIQPNIPSWIGEKSDFKCIAYGIDLMYIPKGTFPDQFECEWDLNLFACEVRQENQFD